MKRGYSILSQVAGLALTAIVAVLLVSLFTIMAAPAPAGKRMSVNEAAAALAGKQVIGLELNVSGSPPEGRDSPLLAASIAELLGVRRDRVRAAWIGGPAVEDPAQQGQTVVFLAGGEGVAEAQPSGGFTLRWGSIARLSPAASVPPFRAALREREGRWLVAAPREPLLSPWRLRLILAFLASAAILAPLSWLIARRLTRPVRGLAVAAEQVRLSPAGNDVPVEGPREIRAAAAAINAMRAKLARELSERTRMLAAVAHDLRNPITSLRVRAEEAPEPARSRMVADLDRMSAMISQVLEYARGGAAREPLSAVDVGALLREFAEDASLRGEKAVLGQVAPELFVRAAPGALRRAYSNLVENACRYAGQATLSGRREGSRALLIVEDDGPGMSQDELERLAEPFERGEPSRSDRTGGAGLGLAIARDIAERHSGRLLLSNRPGGGLLASLDLPLDPTES